MTLSWSHSPPPEAPCLCDEIDEADLPCIVCQAWTWGVARDENRKWAGMAAWAHLPGLDRWRKAGDSRRVRVHSAHGWWSSSRWPEPPREACLFGSRGCVDPDCPGAAVEIPRRAAIAAARAGRPR